MEPQLKNELLEFDFSKELNSEEKEYLDQKLYNLFNTELVRKKECKMIISIRSKLDMDIQENMMISDYECVFDEKFKL